MLPVRGSCAPAVASGNVLLDPVAAVAAAAGVAPDWGEPLIAIAVAPGSVVVDVRGSVVVVAPGSVVVVAAGSVVGVVVDEPAPFGVGPGGSVVVIGGLVVVVVESVVVVASSVVVVAGSVVVVDVVVAGSVVVVVVDVDVVDVVDVVVVPPPRHSLGSGLAWPSSNAITSERP